MQGSRRSACPSAAGTEPGPDAARWPGRALTDTTWSPTEQPATCCAGWYFEHSIACPVPHVPRNCSDCHAAPGTSHVYPACSWYQ